MSTVKVIARDHAAVPATQRRASAGETAGRAIRRSLGQLGVWLAEWARPGRDEKIRTGTVPAHVGRTASAGLLVAGVLAQIAYPLLSGDALRIATVCSVLLLAAAGVVHAATVFGRRAAVLLLVVAGGLGLAAETVGVHTGAPFGQYSYAGTLGPELAGVPIVVPLAWTMLAYPCLLVGRRLARPVGRGRGRSFLTALAGGIGLTGWDLFLDPQMVAHGNWSWTHPLPALPGVPGVPLTNYAGWLLVSVLMIAALNRVLPLDPSGSTDLRPAGEGDPTWEVTPAALLAWTWLGSTIGNLVFFGRPWVALYGGVAMGAVVLPYLAGLFRPATLDAWSPAATRGDGG